MKTDSMRRKLFFIFLLFFLTAILNSCVERYRPLIDKYDNLLVIDGNITNLPGPYTVRLSRSAPLHNLEFIPVTDCELTISDNTGNSEVLLAVEPGIYQTSPSGIQGVVGREYKISILLPDGNTYESDFEELKKAVELDSVYAQIEYRENETVDHTTVGYQFYLDTKMADAEKNYFLWNLNATYHYQSDYTIRWVYIDTLEWFHGPWRLYNCWIDDPISEIFIYSTEGLSSSLVTAFPLHFVNTETRRLSVKYSLFVKQFTISQRAYTFFKGLKENTDQGSLYEQQPSQIRGNVKNINDINEPVLGYFLTAGLHEKRIFVDRPKYPVDHYYYTCELTEGIFDDYADLMWMGWHEVPVYVIETPGGRRAVPHQACVDCRRHGGTIEKPDFWID